MPKHPAKQNRLFLFKDVAERIICPNCKGIVKTVIPAVGVTYLVHHNSETCILDHERGIRHGTA